MKSKHLKRILFILCLIILYSSCDNRKERINKQINDLYSKIISIPYSEMDTLTMDTTCIPLESRYQLLVYVDSTECTPCYVSHYLDWELILKECKKHEPSITLTIIIEGDNITDEVREKFLVSDFSKSIFIDKTGAFRKKNPAFPDSNIMHVLLLDKDNKVTLVGNPLSNKRIEELLYNKLRESR